MTCALPGPGVGRGEGSCGAGSLLLFTPGSWDVAHLRGDHWVMVPPGCEAPGTGCCATSE